MARTSRRLLGGLLALAVVGLSACSSDDEGADGASSGAGWSFTDDLGNTVELDEAPERVAGLNDVVSSLWNYGIAPVATFGQTSTADDVAFEGRDLSDVEILGESYGDIDLEQLAAAAPDVIVTTVYPTDSEGTLDESQPLYGFESVEQQEQVAEIAPIIAIAWRGSAADVIERTAELAEALGADMGSDEVTAARADFEAASAALTEAAAGGLTVLPVAAYADEGFYMAKAPDEPSLRMYGELGVQFVDPGGEDYYWQTAGWETVTQYPSDLILYSLRGALPPEQMAEQPTYNLLPAAQAGQVHPWKYIGMDYAAQAAYMDELAGWLAGAQDVTP
ncbi:ABC transporter substrate-binding protein [Blastococcus sp. TML/M2B]|uniref:ABC transporter substrate-binding protein n=1 Tax=unclassified Blastococcus TaxID=2619396 RepID=UPI00190E13D9|nr:MULTISPECIES: ABC transporter substrate-binding protein [unclassified Blastococcus]MBN1094273.1 ABC transporter substrate-binding protein [Blastococcus sp. TML/M2B]MBN1095607.1 ABC transporter substrate-binding protein [Blastococcus sp. TML/C7B]